MYVKSASDEEDNFPEDVNGELVGFLNGSPKSLLKNVILRICLLNEKFVQPKKWILNKD